MPSTTSNYGFVLPDPGQPNWHTANNGNWSALDAALATVVGGGGGAGAAAHTLSYSATPTFDVSQGSTQIMPLTGSVTASSITNAAPGILTLVFLQDSVGGHSVVFPSNFKGAGSISASDGTATPSSYCSQSFVYIPSASTYVAITPLIYGE